MRGLRWETLLIYLDNNNLHSKCLNTHRATNYCPPTAQTSRTKTKAWQMPPLQPWGWKFGTKSQLWRRCIQFKENWAFNTLAYPSTSIGYQGIHWNMLLLQKVSASIYRVTQTPPQGSSYGSQVQVDQWLSNSLLKTEWSVNTSTNTSIPTPSQTLYFGHWCWWHGMWSCIVTTIYLNLSQKKRKTTV